MYNIDIDIYCVCIYDNDSNHVSHKYTAAMAYVFVFDWSKQQARYTVYSKSDTYLSYTLIIIRGS